MVAYAATQATGDSDRWHVALAPGETKLLTLEQLDDLFRLEVIDAQTKVWQPGMRDGLPLSVVAGLDDDEPPQAVSVAPPPPPSARRPPPPSASRPVPVAVTMPQFAAVPAPVASAWPAVASAAPSLRPVLPESLRPVSFGGGSVTPAQRSGRAGGFIMALAVVAGLAITLYRNGVLRDLAVSTRQETAFLSLESALGGPGFGTPRAIDALPKATTAAAAPVRGTELGAALGSPKLEPSQAKTTAHAENSGSAAASERESGNDGSSQKPNGVSLESLVTEQVGNKQGHKKSAKASSTPPPRSRASEPPKSLGIRGSSNKFDPLNGKL